LGAICQLSCAKKSQKNEWYHAPGWPTLALNVEYEYGVAPDNADRYAAMVGNVYCV
jgi:hypothetical protein